VGVSVVSGASSLSIFFSRFDAIASSTDALSIGLSTVADGNTSTDSPEGVAVSRLSSGVLEVTLLQFLPLIQLLN